MGSISGPAHGSVTTPERENSVSSLRLGSVSLLDHYAINNRQGGPNDGGITLPAIGDADGNRLVIDHENIWRSCKAEEMRRYGSRRVENLAPFSEDFSTWDTPTTTETDNGDGSWTITMNSTGTVRDMKEDFPARFAAGETGRVFIFSIELKDITNGEGEANDVQILCEEWSGGHAAYENGTSVNLGTSITSAWQRFYVVHTVVDASSTDIRVIVRQNNTTSIQSVKVRKAQLEESTGRADTTTPSEYVSTGVESDPFHGAGVDGVKYFDTANGNSVANNVVTEGIGAELSTVKGYMAEGEAINLLASSTARDFTNAAWTKTNITPVKNATGITGYANSASTLTADAGNGTVFQAVTDASALHYATFWVKRKTGTGTIEITVDGGSTYADITSSINSSTFTHVLTSKTAANPSIGFRIVTSGDEIEVDYAGCWDTTYSYSPVEGGVTRLADTEATIPGSYFPDSIGSLEFELTTFFSSPGASAVGLFSVNTGTVTRIARFNTTAGQLLINDATTSVTLSSAYTLGNATTIKIRWGGGTMNISSNGVKATEGAFDGSFNPLGNITLFKSLTQGATIKNIKIYHQDNGDNWLSS